MSQISELSERVAKARERFRAIPSTGPGVYGAPDPQTGERWNAGNVLGHVAEMLPFWTVQCRGVLSGARTVGRDEQGTEQRREGIRKGEVLPEAELRAEIARGLDQLDALLSEVSPDDLDRRIVYRAASGDRDLSLGDFIEANLVGHLEGHLDQLEELT